MEPVLVVDDNQDTRELLVGLLILLGYPAEAVGSGPAALARMRGARPAMVILDVMMPGTNGFDVLREMRADPTLGDVPVVMHSARDDPVTRQLALRDGAQDYITKTRLGYSELKDVVERLVGPAA